MNSSSIISPENSIFQSCTQSIFDGAEENIFECISNRLENQLHYNVAVASQRSRSGGISIISPELADSYYDFLVILSGGLVFFMQAGFAMICGGCVRKKNTQNTMLKNLLDACGAAVAFFCFGFGIAYGGEGTTFPTNKTTFVGSEENFFCRGDIDLGFWFFQYSFSAAAVTIVAGTLAERCRMSAYLLYSFFLAGFVYPVVAHSMWSSHGFLSPFHENPFLGVGMVDFAGGGVVHVTGGSTALFAVYILGSRRGRFYDIHTGRLLEVPNKIPGYSVSLQLLGTLCLWFGWYGFNPGSALFLSNRLYIADAAVLAAVNTSLSAAMGGLSAMFTKLIVEGRENGLYTHFDLVATMNGCLAGLVAITSGCGTVENWAAIIIGLISGVVYVFGSIFLERCKIDDAVDAIPVHFFSGAWGVIATGLFSTPTNMMKVYGTRQHAGWFYSIQSGHPLDFHLLGCQVFGLLFILGWTAIMMVPFFIGLNYLGWFRTESVTEIVGLDMFYHGESSGVSTPRPHTIAGGDAAASAVSPDAVSNANAVVAGNAAAHGVFNRQQSMQTFEEEDDEKFQDEYMQAFLLHKEKKRQQKDPSFHAISTATTDATSSDRR